MKKLLQIVIVVSYTYPYIGSGIGNVAEKQAEEFAKLGHKVTLISSDYPTYKRSYVKNGVSRIRLPCVTPLDRFHIPVPFFLFDGKSINAFREADIIHIHDILYPSSFMASIFSKIYGKKLVLTQHIPLIDYKQPIINLMEKMVFYLIGVPILLLADRIIVVSSEVRDWLQRFSGKISQIPYGVDTDLFHPVTGKQIMALRHKYTIPQDKKVVLFVGRLVTKKGYVQLFEARDRSYLILFAGSGHVPEYMKSAVNVRFLGPLNQTDLAEMYQLSNIFILPSHGEGFPLSIQEALVSGLRVITTRHKMFGNGIFSNFITFTERNPASIRKNISRVLKSQKLNTKIPEAERVEICEYFSWENNIVQTLNKYSE